MNAHGLDSHTCQNPTTWCIYYQNRFLFNVRVSKRSLCTRVGRTTYDVLQPASCYDDSVAACSQNARSTLGI
jgi:hypothetical protein